MYRLQYQKYLNRYKRIKGGDVNRCPEFPFKQYHYSDDDIRHKFNMLTKYEPDIQHRPYKVYNIDFLDRFLYRNKPTVMVKKFSDYEDYNMISDHFQEYCRMRCKRYDQELSPYDYWCKNHKLVRKYAQDRYGGTSTKNLREAIYNLVSECTSFRPTVMVGFIKHFSSRVILDFSAGWGDRLLGALACDSIIDFYCGVDPNSCVHPNYQKMIEFFKNKIKDKTKYQMIQAPFQEAVIPDKQYDLIITSPPYFTLEIYSDEDSQSVDSVSSVDEWLETFLFVSLKKAWDLLTGGGRMVIIINDMRSTSTQPAHKFVEQMITYASSLPGAKYQGVVAYAEERSDGRLRSPQPCWIWKKDLKRA